jgi:hypothetical protein
MLDAKLIAENERFEVTPNVGFVFTVNDMLKTTLEAGLATDVDKGEKDKRLSFEARYSLSKNNTLRLSFNKFRGEEIRASFYHHW